MDATPIKTVDGEKYVLKELLAFKLDIRNVVTENNFSNLVSNNIAQQVDRIENALNKSSFISSSNSALKGVNSVASHSVQVPSYKFSVISNEIVKI